MLRPLIVALVSLAILLGLAELALPRFAERALEVSLVRKFGPPAEADVRLKAYPALKMLLGRIDRVTVESRSVPTTGLIIDELTVSVGQLSLNLRELLTRREVVVTRAEGLEVTVRVHQDHLRQYLLESVPRLTEPELEVEAGRLRVGGRMVLAGRPVRVAAVGTMTAVQDGTRVAFVFQEVAVEGVKLPAEFLPVLTEMLGGPEPFIDLTLFPTPLRAREVRLEPGWLVIEAESAD